MDELMTKIYSFILTAALGIIGFFLKRTIDQVDKKASKEEMNLFREEIKEQNDKHSKNIECIKETYITKDDFYREQAKTERQLSRIIDILLEMKGCSK